MPNILFRCPNTGMNVQHTFDERSAASANEVAVVQCPACARIHLINVTISLIWQPATRLHCGACRHHTIVGEQVGH
jgi:hypothetical protein